MDEGPAVGVVVEAEVPLSIAARDRRLVDPVHDAVDARLGVVAICLRGELHVDDQRLRELRGWDVVDPDAIGVGGVHADQRLRGLRSDPLDQIQGGSVVADRVIGEGTRDVDVGGDLEETRVHDGESASLAGWSDEHKPPAVRRESGGSRTVLVGERESPWKLNARDRPPGLRLDQLQCGRACAVERVVPGSVWSRDGAAKGAQEITLRVADLDVTGGSDDELVAGRRRGRGLARPSARCEEQGGRG